jgi:sporulation protein YlmC with PRC-barrel domain
MLKKHMAACLVASAFITMPVLAQTSTTPGATSPTQPATSAPSPSSGATGAGSGAAASGKFITEQQGTQWRASKLIGLDVYGADNQKIGDVNDVLVDRQGNADAVVVGVGGFLGIGEKNVALPFSAFEWQMDDTRRTASAGTAGSGTAGSSATTTSTTAPAGSPAATGSTSAPAGSARTAASDRGYPDHAVLRMSKADLEGAPTFRYVGESRSDSGAARSTSPATGTGASSPSTAPKQ